MRLLIIAGTPGLLAVGNKYNGGGWIAALQEELMSRYKEEIDMALIHFNEEYHDKEINGCRYYCVPLEHCLFFHYREKEEKYLNRLMEKVQIENPDVILCFGSEKPFALIQDRVKIPVVLHIQGILQPINEFLLPHAMSWNAYKRNIGRYLVHKIWENDCEREKRILSSVKYVLGRTEWDKKIMGLLAPNAKYYHCGEMLRPAIYHSRKVWEHKERRTKKIISIISSPFYKGADVILRCAEILKDFWGDNFEWNVYGISEINEMSSLSGIKPQDVNVLLNGVIDAEQLIEMVCDADLFVHPSYIENSPNTVCEAQILGIPVVATNVGGTSSIIKHGVNGVLIPSNDVFLMAANIKALFEDVETCMRLGKESRKLALARHNPKVISEDLVGILRELIKDRNI